MPIGGPSKRLDCLPGLPDEILQEILIRLPARSVVRCRAVCRSWRHLTSDPAFLVAHHHLQPTLHVISSFQSDEHLFPNHMPSPDRLETVDLRSGERGTVTRLFNASCDGLVVIGNCICNPVTRQRAPLSRKVVVSNLVGLFRHPPSGEYRVLFWRTCPTLMIPGLCLNEYCVLKVGSDDDPRPISSPPPVDDPRNASQPAYETVLIDGQLTEVKLIIASGPTFIGAPVLLHGNMYLHWKKYYYRNHMWHHKILVFDTVAELFRHLRPPAVHPHHTMQLFDMDGTLAASSTKDPMTELRIFAMQDYTSQEWSFQYRIKLPVTEIRRFQEWGDWMAKIVSGEGDVVVSCFGWLLHCNRKGNLVAKYEYQGDLPVVTPHVLKESLVQHAFFQKD